jgi:hypothetical protein
MQCNFEGAIEFVKKSFTVGNIHQILKVMYRYTTGKTSVAELEPQEFLLLC